MKRYFVFVISICFLSVASHAQEKIVTVFEAVKIKNEKRAEAVYYYENNWKVLREQAVKKGYIHSFEFFESKADEQAGFDLVLITRFKDQAQYEKAEENFKELIEAKGGLRLLNELKPGEFRQRVFVKVGNSILVDQ